MMLPVSRFKGQPVGMVTSTTPWLSISSDPTPKWLWLASWSAATYQASPPLVFYPRAVWIPEHTHLIQWERPAVEVVPLLPTFYRSAPLHPRHRLPKLTDGWISPEEVGVFPRREKPLLLTNQIIQGAGGHAPKSRLLLSSSRLSGHVRRHVTNTRDPEDSSNSTSSSNSSSSSSSSSSNSSSSLNSSSLPQRLQSVSPLCLPLFTSPPQPTGGGYWEWAGIDPPLYQEAWPLTLPNQQRRGAWLSPLISLDRRLSLPVQVMKEVQPSFFTSRFSSRFTLLTDYRHKKRGTAGDSATYGGALLLRTDRTSNLQQCVGVSVQRGEEEGHEEGRKDKRPVASTPVPGSPWCVVWTGDDRVFFFNPTIHLSVWERPGELIGRDISHIIEDPPHKRKKMTPADNCSSCKSSGLYGNGDDEDNDHKHNSKRKRSEESLVPHPEEVKLLPLELRIAHFREMMLERGVSAFSTWDRELHKMVFDPRYLLLTSDQRKQVFEQFVKSRVKEEYKEKRGKLQRAREEFKQLLEEAKISSRSTFKEFCARYHGDQRFNALNRKKDQEVIFNYYIISLKKRDKENRARLRKMR
ncbi:transcription elongation regulator 1-like protein isoform X2 [Brachyistius frenatus]|uniref:transcription elongation regulator 1-like protein isoform X2 n=1 Tax=Brachyistius frenatus TaxID=100188 RepID=UPI0037E93E03